jgi:hypothetical protein
VRSAALHKAEGQSTADGKTRAENMKKEAEQNCENKLGHSPEKETQNMSPNATNISHG